MIFGAHGGREEKGLRVEAIQQGSKRRDAHMFCHSPESWKELWEEVFWGKTSGGVGNFERVPEEGLSRRERRKVLLLSVIGKRGFEEHASRLTGMLLADGDG